MWGKRLKKARENLFSKHGGRKKDINLLNGQQNHRRIFFPSSYWACGGISEGVEPARPTKERTNRAEKEERGPEEKVSLGKKTQEKREKLKNDCAAYKGWGPFGSLGRGGAKEEK